MNDASDTTHCHRCGVPLGSQAVGGLCANCLLQLALNPAPPPIATAVFDPASFISAVEGSGDGEDRIGMMIGRYRLMEEIGQGGMGTVFRAEQRSPVVREVALKIIKLGMDTRQVVARFEAERQALALMDHPGIAKVLDAGATTAGRPYFVMELVDGIPITEYCDTHRLPIRARLELFLQVCQAIQHAHLKGVVHRDIKPSNILVADQDSRPIPKIIDFGIAKATHRRLTEKTLFTEHGVIIGTPAYMSPEQAEASGLDVDTRADVYSLGMLLYELLTGLLPFSTEELFGRGYAEMQRIILEQEPPRPSTRLRTVSMAEAQSWSGRGYSRPDRLAADVHGDLDWIVMKCLEKDRRRRYETASSLASDIQRHLTHEPVEARPPSIAYRLGKAVRRNKLAFAGGALVATALVIGLGVSTWALFLEREARLRAVAAERGERDERTKAERAREAAAIERDRAATLLSRSQAEQGVKLLEKNNPAGLLHLLAARRSVEHLPEERIRRTLLWSGWKEALPKPEPVTPELQSVLNAADGDGAESRLPWQARVSTNGQLSLRRTDNGELITTFAVGSGRVSSPEFSADGRLLIITVGRTKALWDLAPVRTGQPPRRLLSGISRHAFDPERLRLVTFANEGFFPPVEPPVNVNQPRGPSVFQVHIWDSSAEDPRRHAWPGDSRDLVNHQLALNPEGTVVAAAWKSLTLWDARTGAKLEQQPDASGMRGDHDFFVPPIFSRDGRWLWEFRDRSCRRYDVTSGRPVGDGVTNLHRFRRPQVSPDGRHLIATLDQGIRVLSLETGESPGPLIETSGENADHAVAVSLDGRRLATVGADRAIRIWDTRTAQVTRDPIIPPFSNARIRFTSDRKRVVVVAPDGRRLIYPTTAPALASVQERPGWQFVGFNPEGDLLVLSVSNRTMQWIDPVTIQPRATRWTLPGAGPISSAAFHPDGFTVALALPAAKDQSVVQFWNTRTASELEPSLVWTNRGSLAFSPDGRALAGLGGDGSIQLWSVGDRQFQRLLRLPKPWEVGFYAIQFSPDGEYLATQSGFKTWHLWHRETGLLSERTAYTAISPDWKLAQESAGLFELVDPRQPKPAARSTRGGMAFSSDGRLLAVTLPDNRLRLWNVTTGSPVGHEIQVGRTAELAFSPDSRLLAVLDHDMTPGRRGSRGQLRLWETSTGLPIGSTVSSRGLGTRLGFDPQSRVLVAGFPSPQVTQIWRLPAGDVTIEEMEQRSQELAGGRLDEAGNWEALPTEVTE